MPSVDLSPPAQERRGFGPWITALLLLPLLALVLGVVMLALVRLWQTGEQLPPLEIAEADTTLVDLEPPTPPIEASDPFEIVVEAADPVEEPPDEPVPDGSSPPEPDPIREDATDVSDHAAPAEPVTPDLDPQELPTETPDPTEPVEQDPPEVVEMGALRLNAYPAARVYVDGEFVGTTLETARGVELPAGDREVRLVRSSDGYEQTIHVVIRARKSLAVPFEWDDS
jgi:hypothetical protein